MAKDAENKLVKEITEYIKTEKLTNRETLSFLDNLKMEVLNSLLIDKDGIFVIKRRGYLESFDDEKLLRNIAAASDDVKHPLTRGELNFIVKRVKEKIHEDSRKIVNSNEIIEYTKNVLENNDYDAVLVGYSGYNR
ncbi:MAG: ATP cone domain-containing protein [Tissierellia bacterium]|nr:ATP cone domain-containing protein [Tissierellia bacterium]